jgi:HK97 family phage prohead protease
MALLSAAARKALPDSAYAYIDPQGGRHFPIHDKAHVIAALRLGPRSPMWAKAKGKVMAAAKKFGVGAESDSKSDTGRSLESLYPEIRFYPDKVELRADQSDQNHIVGYAAVFGAVSRRLGGFHEKVLPTAFNRAMEQGWQNVVCRYNHKDDFVLGTTSADTCRLAIDERGLQYDVIPPETRMDVTELVQRGDVRYSSFAFRCVDEEGDSWEKSEYNLPMRSLHSVELVDVAPVMDPAYRDTTAMARNITGAVESLARWVNEDPNEVRSMMEAGQAIKFFKRTDRPSVPAVTPEAAEARACDDIAVSLRSRWEKFETSVADEERQVTNALTEDGQLTSTSVKGVEEPTTTDMLDEDGKLDLSDLSDVPDVADEAVEGTEEAEVKSPDEVLDEAEDNDLALARAFMEELEARGEINLDD